MIFVKHLSDVESTTGYTGLEFGLRVQIEQRGWARIVPEGRWKINWQRRGECQEHGVRELQGTECHILCPRSRSMCQEMGEGVSRSLSDHRFLSQCSAGGAQVNLLGPLSPAGRDASRAFVTGDYSEAGLVDDVSDLSFSEVLTLQNWLSFYEKNYELVGRYSTGLFHRFHLVVLQVF